MRGAGAARQEIGDENYKRSKDCTVTWRCDLVALDASKRCACMPSVMPATVQSTHSCASGRHEQQYVSKSTRSTWES